MPALLALHTSHFAWHQSNHCQCQARSNSQHPVVMAADIYTKQLSQLALLHNSYAKYRYYVQLYLLQAPRELPDPPGKCSGPGPVRPPGRLAVGPIHVGCTAYTQLCTQADECTRVRVTAAECVSAPGRQLLRAPGRQQLSVYQHQGHSSRVWLCTGSNAFLRAAANVAPVGLRK